MSIIIPSSFFIPFESIKLGRFVTNINHPHQGHHDPISIDPPKVLVSQRSSYTGSHHNTFDHGFASALTSLLSTGFSKRAKVKVGITTEHVNTYTLDNSDAWFEEAVQTSATRSWMERAVERGDQIYLIIGFHTITNASIVQYSAKEGQLNGQISLPISLSLNAAGAIAPLGNLIDPAVGGTRQVLDSFQSEFIAPGEQVCALQYRKLCHKWLSSKDINTSRLSRTQWSYVTQERLYKENGEDGVEDVIEVGLEEFNIPDGEWDVEQLPGGDTLLIHA